MLSSVALILALHVVSGLEPWSHRLSEYVDGRGGGLMTAAFLLLGLGLTCLGLAIAGHGPRGLRPSIAVLCLVAAGLGLAVAGLYPTVPDSAVTSEIVHSRASGAATFLLIAAALSWSTNRPGDPRRPRIWLAVTGAVLGMASVVLHDTSITGLGQRALWAVLALWVLVAAFRLEGAERRPRRGGAHLAAP